MVVSCSLWEFGAMAFGKLCKEPRTELTCIISLLLVSYLLISQYSNFVTVPIILKTKLISGNAGAYDPLVCVCANGDHMFLMEWVNYRIPDRTGRRL